jgi:hypothetical protein
MADGHTKTSSRSSKQFKSDGHHFDWLTDLDSRAAELPRADSWLQYPWFMFVRYPHLIPEIAEQKYLAWQVETGATTIAFQLEGQIGRIAGHEHGCQILEDLTANQRSQLAALVIDCLSEFKKHREAADHRKRLTGLKKEATRRQRMLEKKTVKVVNALSVLRAYAATLDDWLGASHKRFAESGLEAAEHLKHFQSAQEWRQDLELHRGFHQFAGFTPFPGNLAASSNVQLFWFFKTGCGLSQNDSSLRVALLRNAFFHPWAKKIGYCDKHRVLVLQSRKSGAVIQDVRRFRPDKNHSA